MGKILLYLLQSEIVPPLFSLKNKVFSFLKGYTICYYLVVALKVVDMLVPPVNAGSFNTQIPDSLLLLFNLPFFHLPNFFFNIFLVAFSSFE